MNNDYCGHRFKGYFCDNSRFPNSKELINPKEGSMGKNKIEEKKLLNLDFSRTERAFKKDESIWDSETDRMLNLIKNHVETLNKLAKRNEITANPLLSIGIFGAPGSGKSSLLNTFVHQSREDDDCDKRDPRFNDFYSLPVIKPGASAIDEHFLYVFLAEALKEDRELHKEQKIIFTILLFYRPFNKVSRESASI